MNLTAQEKRLLSLTLSDTEICAKTLFPNRFKLNFSPDHHRVFAAIDDDSIQKLVIAANRGFGKSSIVQLAFQTRQILARKKSFIVPISCTATQAEKHSDNLKRELETNRFIKQYFPPVKSDIWAKDMWMVANPVGRLPGTLIMPRGRGQQIRGFLHGDERPDLLIADDLEDAESVMSLEQRQKLKEWFYADVLGSVDISRKDWRIIVIGTVLHEDSLLSNLLEDPSWTSMRLELCDDEYRSNWPEKMSDDECRQLAENYRLQGLSHIFSMEYRNLPMDTESAPFKQEHIIYWESATDLERVKYLPRFVIMDPAKSSGLNACDTAIVGVAVDQQENVAYLLDMVCERLHPNEAVSAGFDMCDAIGAKAFAYEETGLNEYISYPIENEMRARGKYYELIPLKARRGASQYSMGTAQDGKDARIAQSLIPLFRRGQVRLPKHHPLTSQFIHQLLTFPRGKRKDLIDAFAYITGFMSAGERFFMNKENFSKVRTSYDINSAFLDPRKEQEALARLRADDRYMTERLLAAAN
jgi:hypothetical protein